MYAAEVLYQFLHERRSIHSSRRILIVDFYYSSVECTNTFPGPSVGLRIIAVTLHRFLARRRIYQLLRKPSAAARKGSCVGNIPTSHIFNNNIERSNSKWERKRFIFRSSLSATSMLVRFRRDFTCYDDRTAWVDDVDGRCEASAMEGCRYRH